LTAQQREAVFCIQHGAQNTKRKIAVLPEKLIELVSKLIAQAPVEFAGFKWAAMRQCFIATKIGVSQSTLTSLLKDPMFAQRPKRIEGEMVTLLRVRVSGETRGPDECAHVLRRVWKNKIGKAVDKHQEHCLYFFARDMLKDFPSVDPVAVFAYALDHWPTVAWYIKQADWVEKCKIGYEVRFKEFPTIPTILKRYKTVLHCYALAQQGKLANNAPKAELDANALLIQQTDPGDPEWTDELFEAWEKSVHSGHKVMAAKALQTAAGE
jgi:hypothetical protein